MNKQKYLVMQDGLSFKLDEKQVERIEKILLDLQKEDYTFIEIGDNVINSMYCSGIFFEEDLLK